MEYKSLQDLYNFLNVANNPQKHWSHCSSWNIVEYI